MSTTVMVEAITRDNLIKKNKKKHELNKLAKFMNRQHMKKRPSCVPSWRNLR